VKVAGLFAGIGGLELGLSRKGHETLMFCEIDPCAQAVLGEHFPDIPIVPDVCALESLPSETELVTAGFPCQDLSQAGGTKGIKGDKSGVVSHLFRLLEHNDIPHVIIENVSFMLQLGKGQAMRYIVEQLENLSFNWAYRVVDARAFGLPQRRERVFLIASRDYEPWRVLFDSDYPPMQNPFDTSLASGFYWTEGSRGLGLVNDAVPPLKGGSTIGIPSPPAIWMPDGSIRKPTISDAERLQGFPAGWTAPALRTGRPGFRWKLVGNAVPVDAAEWLGERLNKLSNAPELTYRIPYQFDQARSWPSAAFGSAASGRWALEISRWPMNKVPPHLLDFLSEEPEPLSYKAVTGFTNRLRRSSLRYPPEFMEALVNHQSVMGGFKSGERELANVR
jgi:DNA (cytosine-5)-methyltransferase 1